jgi:hypothetical protein
MLAAWEPVPERAVGGPPIVSCLAKMPDHVADGRLATTRGAVVTQEPDDVPVFHG